MEERVRVYQAIPSLERAFDIAKDAKAIAFRTSEEGLVLFNYLFSDQQLWTQVPESRNLRGIVYEQTSGRVVSLPFHKFFNPGEPASPDVSKYDFGKSLVSKKHDGYLLQTFVYRGKVYTISRHSFKAPLVQTVLQGLWDKRHERFVLQVSEEYPQGITLLWEVIHPLYPVLELPEKPSLVLLAARMTDTGDYLFPVIEGESDPPFEVKTLSVPSSFLSDGITEVARWLPVSSLFENYSSWNDIKQQVKSIHRSEGYVIALFTQEGSEFVFDDFVKAKTPWAFKASLLFANPGDTLVRSVVEDKVDDLVYEVLKDDPRLQAFSKAHRTLLNHIYLAYDFGLGLSQKQVEAKDAYQAAVSWSQPYGKYHPELPSVFTPLIMKAYRGASFEEVWENFKKLMENKKKLVAVSSWIELTHQLHYVEPDG